MILQHQYNVLFYSLRRLLWRSWLLTKIYNQIINDQPLIQPCGYVWIGGFPRSGNTFASAFIEHMTTCGYVEKHIHSPAQVLKFSQSEDRGLVVFRKPIDACISLSIFAGIKMDRAFQNYIDFHTILVRYGKNIRWANFDLVTKSPLSLIKALELENQINNHKVEEFKTQPDRIVNEVYRRVDDNWILKPDEIFHRQTARPNANREVLKKELEKAVLESRYLTDMLNASNSIFEKIKNLEGRTSG